MSTDIIEKPLQTLNINDTNNTNNNILNNNNNNELYIQTTTHNYVSRNAIVLNAKQVEIKGRTIIESNCNILNGETNTNDGSTNNNNQTWIRIGRYCHIKQNTIIQSPILNILPNNNNNNNTDNTTTDNNNNNKKYIPIQIGSHTIINKNCIIYAAAIGSYCIIGTNVYIDSRVIIKDCCIIESNTYISCDTIIPPFTRVKSNINLYDNININNNNEDEDDTSNNINTTLQYIKNKKFYKLIITELPPSISIRLQEQTMEYYQEFSLQQRKLQLLNKNKI